MDLNDPVNDGTPDGLVQFGLKAHVVAVDFPLALVAQHVSLDGTAVLAYVVNVVEGQTVRF